MATLLMGNRISTGFVNYASPNTISNIETLGILIGKFLEHPTFGKSCLHLHAGPLRALLLETQDFRLKLCTQGGSPAVLSSVLDFRLVYFLFLVGSNFP